MGIEKQFVKDDKMSIQVSDEEWDAAEAIQKLLLAKKVFTPFKISRSKNDPIYKNLDKDTKEVIDQCLQDLNHSFIVYPSSKEGEYHLGCMSRAKKYTGVQGDIHEGILGHGAFGVVRPLVFRNGEEAVIKIQSYDSDNEGRKAIHGEVEIGKMQGLVTSSFIRARNKETPWMFSKNVKDKHYTIMKRLPGENMDSAFKKKKKLDIQQALNIAVKVATAVNTFHQKWYIHCDIKPSNMMYSEKNDEIEIHLIDYGFALPLRPDHLIERSGLYGTPFFMSPELFQAKDKGKFGILSHKSDGYALGVTLQSLFFSADLKLSGNKSLIKDLKSLIKDEMMHKDMETRLSVQEFLAKMNMLLERCLERKSKMKGISKQLNEYKIEKNILRSNKGTQQLSFLGKKGINYQNQIEMSDKVGKLLKKYSQDDEVSEDDLIMILEQMKNNQKRHRDATFATASSFNLQLLYWLPVLERNKLFDKLKIAVNDPLRKDSSITWSKRKHLARKLNALIEKDEQNNKKTSKLE